MQAEQQSKLNDASSRCDSGSSGSMSETNRMPKRFACPCCEQLTLPDEPPGTYEICEACGWEDDFVQFRDPDYRGGANRQSLREARDNFKRYGRADAPPSPPPTPRSRLPTTADGDAAPGVLRRGESDIELSD